MGLEAFGGVSRRFHWQRLEVLPLRPACSYLSGVLGRRGIPGSMIWDLDPCLRYTINDQLEDTSG